MTPMAWYDKIAFMYDVFANYQYGRMRMQTIELLNINDGDTVIDIGCGTGLNINAIHERVGSGGRIYAIEPSLGMLKYAQRKFQHDRFENVIFINKTLEDFLSDTAFEELKSLKNLKIVSTLVFSVIPNADDLLQMLMREIQKGSSFSIMDLHAMSNSFISRFVDRIAKSDINKKFWEPCNGLVDYSIVHTKLCCYFGIECYIMHGTK